MKTLTMLATAWLVSLVAALPAHAAWVKAETDRFIVYGDVSEQTARDFAVRLNTFDTVLHVFNPRADSKPPRRKFEVYLVARQSALYRVSPRLPVGVAGFYASSPQAEFAIAWTASEGLSADNVLFHEYAHHFMLDKFAAAYPPWFVEGWAEYFGATEVTPTGVKVGGVIENRAAALGLENWIRWEDLIGKRRSDLRRDEQDNYYPQAWLLVHYMMSSKERADQLNKVVAAIAAGQEPVAAFRQATGMGMPELNAALRDYTKLKTVTLDGLHPNVEVKVTPMPASADDMLLDRLRLARMGVTDPPAGLLASVRRNAARHPGDALAEQVLALAEFTLGDIAAGEAIVGRRLAAQSDETETLRIAGVGQVLAGERIPAEKPARFRAARPLLIQAYGQDPADFRTLFAYAFSRSIEPDYPNANDLNALHEAHGLAAGSDEIALMLGAALMKSGAREEAARVLAIVANDPHGGRLSERTRQIAKGEAGVSDMELTGFHGDDDDRKPSKPKGAAQ